MQRSSGVETLLKRLNSRFGDRLSTDLSVNSSLIRDESGLSPGWAEAAAVAPRSDLLPPNAGTSLRHLQSVQEWLWALSNRI